MKKNKCRIAGALLAAVLAHPAVCGAWISSQTGRTNESCESYLWSSVTTDLTPDIPNIVVYDNASGVRSARGKGPSKPWDISFNGFVTLNNPTDHPIQVDVGLINSNDGGVCLLDGSCTNAQWYFTGNIYPNEERQIQFTGLLVEQPANATVQYEVVMKPHSGGLVCVNASYYSLEHD